MQVMRITGNVFNLLVMVNCAANFILYSAFSTKFRSTFSSLFCACRASDHAPALCYCCGWSVPTHSSVTGRDINQCTSVAGRYASLPAGGHASTTKSGGGGGGGVHFSTSITFCGDTENAKDENEILSSTTTDKLMMSSQSGVEEDPDDLHITTL